MGEPDFAQSQCSPQLLNGLGKLTSHARVNKIVLVLTHEAATHIKTMLANARAGSRLGVAVVELALGFGPVGGFGLFGFGGRRLCLGQAGALADQRFWCATF